jgi:hypothetical protein
MNVLIPYWGCGCGGESKSNSREEGPDGVAPLDKLKRFLSFFLNN